MALSGTYAFDPSLSRIAEEAFERAGIAPHGLGDDHAYSALHSMNLLLSEWSNFGIREWRIARASFFPTLGQFVYELAIHQALIKNAVIRKVVNGKPYDRPILHISRDAYMALPDKETPGVIDRYMIERQRTTPTIIFYRPSNTTTDEFIFDFWWQFNDAAGAGRTGNIDVPYRFLEAFHAGLAARLAMKFKPERFQMLQEYYIGPKYAVDGTVGGVLGRAITEDRDKADIRFRIGRHR